MLVEGPARPEAGGAGAGIDGGKVAQSRAEQGARASGYSDSVRRREKGDINPHPSF